MPLSSTSETIEKRPSGLDDFPVVGIGASAGGLDAFARLLSSLPADTGCAFVLIQHLDADHPSSLSEILGRKTAMPVREPSDSMRLVPNRVFVIPPNTELTIDSRTIQLRPRSQLTPQHMPIDRFLQSLAEDCGPRAAGVVLSGGGADGAMGLMAVKEAGGVTFAQEPSTAEFPSMPKLAIAAGGVDAVLPPEEIAEALAQLARHLDFAAAPSIDRAFAEGSDKSSEVGTICGLMHEATGVDFSLYRETTVHRRILRRLALRNIGSLGEYVQVLTRDPAERAALERDLLIGVTRFFRDAASFQALERLVFPVILRDRPAHAILRIWVAGCASGEEAYSILIALKEYQKEQGSARRVQLFATDVSEPAIVKARAGRYPESIAADVSPERLQRYFTRVEDGYQIAKELREQCIFSRHNLLDDFPFSKLDLISCRNVLIYLDAVQKRIIPMFHFALDGHGFLMLGKSETVHFTDLFVPIEPQLRIYSKKPVARTKYGFLVQPGVSPRDTGGRNDERDGPSLRFGSSHDVSREADRILLSRHSPSGVLLDENLEVLEIRGRPMPFLELMTGKVSFHLLKLVPDTGLFLEIEKLVQRAAFADEVTRGDRLAYDVAEGTGEVNVEVTPLHSKERRAYLVLFEAADRASSRTERKEPPDVTGRDDRRVANLKRQLDAARQRLTSLVEQHESSEQENLQVTEEALSANEELQSLTEELETSKEELQSTNEELISVNRDLESRNTAIASARDFARSILETVLVPLLVVDSDLSVRHVNASFGKAFRTSPDSLEGEPFYSVCGAAWDVPELRSLVGAVLSERKPFDGLEMELTFPQAGTRTLVLSGRHIDQLNLALLTVEDVTEFKQAEGVLRKREEEHRQAEKMEAIGRLAGGIAHDFNNLLTVIIADCDFLSETLKANPEVAEHLAEIRRTAERAAALTEQLLSFSRRKVLQPTPFDLNLVVAEFGGMLQRLLGERIRVVVQCGPGLWPVTADAGEIGRIVMNLCLNSRDAMPNGGTLTIETGNEVLDQARAQMHNLTAGKYVRLTIRDTGAGMDDIVRNHLFEPFFSTKDISEGGGLGLPTVLGIVQQSGGAISLESEPGVGTRFTILLPVGDVPEVANPADGLPEVPRGDSKVVLLVDDESGVRRVVRRILENLGYVVIETKDAEEALSVLEDNEAAVDILVSDVVMPGMGGRELAERAVALRPAMKVLLVSGYTEDVVVREGRAPGAAFLQKPFTSFALAHKVGAVLDSQPN